MMPSLAPFWIASLMACKDDGKSDYTQIGHLPIGLNATTEDEAKAEAFADCLKRFPLEDGWTDHSANVCLMRAKLRFPSPQ